jgi:pre-mRNA-splicing factor ATP-dependent RNA helicase DHX15/PRP43
MTSVAWYVLTCLPLTGGQDKNWAWNNFLAARALAQADNVRAQLMRTMERQEIELVSISDPVKMYKAVRMALVSGYFMQIAHKEGEKGQYVTVKDNQVVGLHPSCGLETQPEWVLFNEFVLTTRPYIRTVTDIRAEWCVLWSTAAAKEVLTRAQAARERAAVL